MKTLKIIINPDKKEKVKIKDKDGLKHKLLDAVADHLQNDDVDIEIKRF